MENAPQAGAAKRVAEAKIIERQGGECPSGMSLSHWFGVMKAPVVDTKPPRFQFGVDLDEAFAETDVVPGIVLLHLNWSGNHRIDSDYRHKEQNAPGFERFRSRPEERTFFIDCMAQSQCRREDRQSIKMQFQNIKISEVSTFEQWLITRKHDSKLGFDHAVLILVANTHHQRGASIQGRDYDRPAKHDARNRSRETDENQSGHDREQKHAGHDFNCADDVSVERLRVHVAVAHSGERLDAEEKAIEKPMPTSAAGDAVLLQAVKSGEEQIESDINNGDEHRESRPV